MTGHFGTSHSIAPDAGPPKPNHRLDSWKEIATFFCRDERTVKRWEKERSLPVHRLPGGSRARVFAFTEELERWMKSPESAAAEEIASAGPPAEEAVPEAGVPTAAVPLVSAPIGRSKSWIAWACLVLVALVGVIAWRLYAGHAASIAPVKASTHVNPEAEELYLQGRYYWNRRTPTDLTKAVDYFTQAIVRDPSYAQPYVGLADCYNLLSEFSAMPADEAYPRALAAAKKAVELDGNSAEAHASLAFVTFYWSWDTAGAEAEFRRAIALNPNYVTAHHWYATFLMANGRFSESLQEFEAAQKLEPGSAPILADKAVLLVNERRLDEAEKALKHLEASQPEFAATHRYLASIYLAQGDYQNYLREARETAVLLHDENEAAIVRAAEKGFRSGGGHGLLEERLRMEEKLCQEGKLSPFLVAESAAFLGEKQEALQYLQQAYRTHDTFFPWTAVDSWFVGLRNEPEFQKLLHQGGSA